MSTSSRIILLLSVVLAACTFMVSAAPIVNNELEAGSSVSVKVSKHIKKLKSSSSSSSGSYSGDGTFYAPGLGSCGWDNSASEMIVALNHGQMANGANPNKNPMCGKSISVTGPKGSVTVKVVDTCPGCSTGDLDLSPAAFNKIADPAKGRVKINWSFN
jgi:expansin (peptidoglycan-binding protein)